MKLLVWNIEQFTENKFQDYTEPPSHGWTKKRRRDFDAQNRISYMQNVITASGNAAFYPDVIAILEVKADKAAALGTVMSAANAAGILTLLTNVKAWTGNINWRLVPPRKCNPANDPGGINVAHEVVGVLYDNARVEFRGPAVWPAAYPAPWNDPNITNGTLAAGQIRFYRADGSEIDFPADYHRRPFLVDFRERHGAMRLIRCLFSHTSPGFHVGGTQAISEIQEMSPAAGAGVPDFCVAAGDFNVNDWNLTEAVAYYDIIALNYTKIFNTGNQQSTHLRRKADAEPEPNPFGYMQHKLIDNFLVRQTAAAPPPAYVGRVINMISGAPAPYATVMNTTLAALALIPNKVASFREWENFWSIVATSDHVPIFLEIP